MTRLKEFGVWSEQTSSSGKRYYYNRETEVSQWEKPTEWKEHEKALMEKYKLSRTSSKMNLSKSSSSSSSAKPLTSDPNPHASSSSTVHASLSSTPTPKHHNSSLSGVRASSSSASNLVSGSQSSVQKSRTSDGLKRPRDDDRHHHHSSSKSSYLDPFAAPQNLTISNERSRTVGDKSERIISTNASRWQANKDFQGFSTRQPSSSTRPSVSGCSGETNVHTPTSSMSSSKHHSAALFPSSNQRPPAISAANSVMPSPHCSTPKSRLPEGLKRLRDDDHHHHQSSGKEMPSTPQASSSNERSVTRSSTTVEKSTEKPVVLNALPIFNEAKYLSLYRTDLTSHRRNWSSHAYTNEARRCAEKNAKQATVLNAIDDDVRSVRSLMKAAELRCSLLDQRLTFIRGQIANLEAKNPPA